MVWSTPSQGPEVRSGDLPQPLMMKKGDPFTFTIKRGVSEPGCVSVNYDGFVDDVSVGDEILVDGEEVTSSCDSNEYASLASVPCRSSNQQSARMP